MPSRERSTKDDEREDYLNTLDDAVLNAPNHVKQRLGLPSPLGDAIQTKSEYGYNGYRFCESGQAIKLENTGGANRARHHNSIAIIQRLAEKYSHIWNKRSGAGIIARLTGIKADTIRRYKRLLPHID